MIYKLKPSWFDIITGKHNRYDDVIRLRKHIEILVDGWDNSPIIERLEECVPTTPPPTLTNAIIYTFNEVYYYQTFGHDELIKELTKRRNDIISELEPYVLSSHIENEVNLVKQIIREEKINSIMSD